MKIVLPEKVKFIIETLEEHGYEAYAVGGCVRDTMLHRRNRSRLKKYLPKKRSIPLIPGYSMEQSP